MVYGAEVCLFTSSQRFPHSLAVTNGPAGFGHNRILPVPISNNPGRGLNASNVSAAPQKASKAKIDRSNMSGSTTLGKQSRASAAGQALSGLDRLRAN